VADKIKVRTVNIRGAVYIRAEDVANYIREFASTEETDVRTRANTAADNLLNIGK
jgi:hypothetical protein